MLGIHEQALHSGNDSALLECWQVATGAVIFKGRKTRTNGFWLTNRRKIELTIITGTKPMSARHKALSAPNAIRLIVFILASAGLTACDDEDDDKDKAAAMTDGVVPGLVKTTSVRSTAESIGEVEAALTANPAAGVFKRIDHQANAALAGLELPPTEVLLFGNPALGTPLMQANQLVGLDLPQKILAFEDGGLKVAFNTAAYLQKRHGLTNVEESLAKIDGALSKLVERASGTAPDTSAAVVSVNETTEGEGVISVSSQNDFVTTVGKLKQAIDSAGPLTLVGELDHQANAASVDLELRPTTLLVFGNPRLGTPLMQNQRSVAIDLPQKMLVFEDAEGKVFIAYNDPVYLAQRHGIVGQDDTLTKIAGALNGLASGAASLE